jgi:hypothetical protein
VPISGKKNHKLLIEETVLPGSMIYTDEYAIYNRLNEWGYKQKAVNHENFEYARNDDGDGFFEVHVNTMEGVPVSFKKLLASASWNLTGKTSFFILDSLNLFITLVNMQKHCFTL